MCVNQTLAVLLDQSVFSNYRRCGITIGLASGVLSGEIMEERSGRGIWLEPEEDDEMARRGFGMREGAAGGPSECLPMRRGGGEGVGNPTDQMYMTRKG